MLFKNLFLKKVINEKAIEEKVEKKIMSHDSFATMEGELSISIEKLKHFYPKEEDLEPYYNKNLKGHAGYVDRIQFLKEHMQFGSCEPAVVVSKDPLLVAVYSEDIDCVLILYFPNKLLKKYPLNPGVKLLSVNTYGRFVHEDITHGPKSSHTWNAFWPVIAEFVSDDYKTIKAKKAEFPEEQWNELYSRGRELLKSDNIIYRFGAPFSSDRVLDENTKTIISGEVTPNNN